MEQRLPPLSDGHNLEAKADFQKRDRGRPNRSAGLAVEPGDDFGVGSLKHQGGEDVGIENGHPGEIISRT